MAIEGQQKVVTVKRVYIYVVPRNGEPFRHVTERTAPFSTIAQANEVIRKVSGRVNQYDKVYSQLRRYLDAGAKVGVEVETETKVVSSVFVGVKRRRT